MSRASRPVNQPKAKDNKIRIPGDRGVGISQRGAFRQAEAAGTHRRTRVISNRKKELSRKACRGRIR